MDQLTNDLVIRKKLLNELHQEQIKDSSTVIIPELEICMGYARADIVMVNGSIHGFEIKSDKDTLERLTHQIGYYEQVFEHVTIVCGKTHVDKAKLIVPPWWEVAEAIYDDTGNIVLKKIKDGSQNSVLDAASVAQLLWRDEALEALKKRGIDRGVKSKPRRFILERLIDNVSLEELLAITRHAMKARLDWRTV
ncbi:MAG: sce7726 family protein [Megasphaera cerevisiae]|nr:sce7726 family protein [Megasphaera cerevisiae]